MPIPRERRVKDEDEERMKAITESIDGHDPLFDSEDSADELLSYRFPSSYEAERRGKGTFARHFPEPPS